MVLLASLAPAAQAQDMTPPFAGSAVANEDCTQVVVTYNEDLKDVPSLSSAQLVGIKLLVDGRHVGFPTAGAIDGTLRTLTLTFGNQAIGWYGESHCP